MEFQSLKVLIVKELPLIKVLIRLVKSDFDAGEEISDEEISDREETKSDEEETKSDEEETKSDEEETKSDKEETIASKEGDELDKEESKLTKEKAEDLKLDMVLFNGNVEFPSLEELRVKHLPELEHVYVYDQGDENLVAGGSFFPNLKTLHLTGGKETMLKQLPKQMLRKLSSLKISKLKKQRCLVSSGNVPRDDALLRSVSELENLEQLTVKDCYAMEAIIAKAEDCVDKAEVEEEDCEFLFPVLKKITLSWMHSLDTFSSTSNTIRFPSLESLEIFRCRNIRSFSLTSPVAPELREIEVNWEKILIDQGFDLNTTLQQQFCSTHKLAMQWPAVVKHELHKEHELRLLIRNYTCNGCREKGEVYSYCCRKCDFDLHPTCALEDIQITANTSETEVLKSWPRTLNHRLHEKHELKLVMGRNYGCDGCKDGKGDEIFSYYCAECDFDLHPRCAVELKSPEDQEMDPPSSTSLKLGDPPTL